MPYHTDFATATENATPRGARYGKPVIGLSANVDGQTSRLHDDYVNAILEAGGIPLIIPATTDAGALREIADIIDGLLLTGGADIGGEYFGEETLQGLTEIDPFRDAYDFLLLRLAADRCLPVFGICRGVQVMNVAFGGTLWQDIPSQFPGSPLAHSILEDKHKPVHGVELAKRSVLASVFGARHVQVNSRHHQAIKDVAPGFKIAATSPDGVIEAIEGFPLRRMFGVQWHPENMAAQGGDRAMKALFSFFVNEAALMRRAKGIHRRYFTVDSHCDTPMLFAEHTVNIGRRDPVAKVDLVKMGEGMLDAVFVVAYLPQGPCDDHSRGEAFDKAVALLREVSRQVEANRQYAGIAHNFAQALKLKNEGRKAVFLGIENGYAIGEDMKNIDRFKDMGVSYITLCHNGSNDLCDSAVGETIHGGLSLLGSEAVRRMNRAGVVVDISHAAETTVRDVLKESASPVIASHSSARALCDHPRNLTDEQLRAIAAKGGVVQVCLYSGFLAAGREATITDVMAHIDHIVHVAGINHVGIGSDFDGGGGIPGCDSANEMINITVELLRRGYQEEDIAGMWGGNLRRVMDAVQSRANK